MADMNIRAVITADDKASAAIRGVGESLRNLGEIAGGLVTFRGLADIAKDLITSFNESQGIAAQLGAVLQSTGSAAGVTAGQAEELAKSLQQVTTYSDETVGSAENMLLTFTNIGGSVFPEATQAVLDLSTALGIDTTQAAIQVGKALNDPIQGTLNLRREGVSFNQTQQETITKLVQSGHGMEAQKLILQELTKEFGGSAKAAGTTFGGQMKILGNNIDDVKERIGKILSEALGPFLSVINDFVKHNGQMIASLVVAGLAAGAFAAVIIAVAGAIALATAVMGPYAILLGVLAALIGVVVFGSMQKLQDQVKKTASSFGDSLKKMSGDGANNFGAMNKLTDEQKQKLADLADQMAKTTRDFQQSLAQMVSDHQQKVTDLKAQLADETKAFEDAQAAKNLDFKSSNDKLVSDHADKVSEIESQIKQELIAGTDANAQRINDLRIRLAQENEAYNKQVADNQLKYDDDKNKAIASHEAKTTSLQKQLDAENVLLTKHATDISAIQGVQLLDEIDKLKQSHADQMAQYAKQSAQILKTTQDTTTGQAGIINNLPNLINSNGLNDIAGQLGTKFGEHFLPGLVNSLEKALAPLGEVLLSFDPLLGPKKMGEALLKTFKFGGIPGFADGGTVPGPTGAPTLAVVHGGEQVIPVGGGGGGGSVNVTLNGVFMGTAADGRRLAEMVKGHLQDIAGSKNMSVAEFMG